MHKLRSDDSSFLKLFFYVTNILVKDHPTSSETGQRVGHNRKIGERDPDHYFVTFIGKIPASSAHNKNMSSEAVRFSCL
jgi:hypothetical protein